MPSINEILGTLPSGRVLALPDDKASEIIRDHCTSQSEIDRKAMARNRLDLYRDKGEAQIREMVNSVFGNSRVKELRQKFVDIASFQNLTKRIIREISSVYSESATRSVRGGRVEQYKSLQARLRMDRKMRQLNQRVNLLNECLVWFDVSLGKPKIHIVTPDNMSVLPHPNDQTELAAVVIDATPMGVSRSETDPHFIVYTDEEFFKLDKNYRMVGGSRQNHGLPRMPMLLVHREEPEVSLLSPNPGSDIISAHKAVALLNTMLLKHQKSGTKQGVISGDIGDMPHGQPMDEEHLLQAPEGAILSTLDLGANPGSYIDSVRAVIKQIAANYGIPESVFDLSYQSTSGFEIELKRTGLREIRRDQIVDYRPVEREFAEIMSLVLTESSSPDAFRTDGWSIDFGEMEAPQDPSQRLNYWEHLRKMGLMNTYEMYMELNPEATEQEAEDAIAENAIVEARRVELFRSLQISPTASSDGSDEQTGAGANFNGGNEPEDDSDGSDA